MSRHHNIPTLIVVHPGSACGSADFNLGHEQAGEQRLNLQEEIESWHGAVVVIDSSLSDELAEGTWKRAHRDLGRTIENALCRARDAGFLSLRIRGDDAEEHDQQVAALSLVHKHGWGPSTPITVTGAWLHSSTREGCVGSVLEVLEKAGLKPLLGSPMDLDAEGHDEEPDETENEPVPRHPRP